MHRLTGWYLPSCLTYELSDCLYSYIWLSYVHDSPDLTHQTHLITHLKF